MPLTRENKTELLQEYEQGLATAPHAFVLGYQGIKVPQVTELREKVRQSGGEYVVVKNTIALRAIDGNALAQLKEHFVGPTAVAYGNDPVALAKALTDFAKDVPVLQFKGGLVEGRAVPAAQIKDIAALPSRGGAHRQAAVPDAVADHPLRPGRSPPCRSRWWSSSTRSARKKKGPIRTKWPDRRKAGLPADNIEALK